MVSLENLVQINGRCNAIWDLNRASDTVFGGLPIVVFMSYLEEISTSLDRSVVMHCRVSPATMLPFFR